MIKLALISKEKNPLTCLKVRGSCYVKSLAPSRPFNTPVASWDVERGDGSEGWGVCVKGGKKCSYEQIFGTKA